MVDYIPNTVVSWVSTLDDAPHFILYTNFLGPIQASVDAGQNNELHLGTHVLGTLQE
jgi:hypothetical protein